MAAERERTFDVGASGSELRSGEDPGRSLASRGPSDVDAMGLDKRRPVVGGQYGPSRGRQAATYGITLAVVAALVLGFLFVVNEFDQPPDRYPDTAPWAQQDAPQLKPRPLDFPRNGDPGTGG